MDDLRRARRALWAFRLIFYPGAVIVAVLLLTGRSQGDVVTFMEGTTSQGAHVELRLDGDGRPSAFGAGIRLRCPAGDWWISWYHQLEDGRLDLEDVASHRYRFHDQTGRRTVRLAARLDGGTLNGTVTAVERFDGPYWGRYVCASGPVSFSAD